MGPVDIQGHHTNMICRRAEGRLLIETRASIFQFGGINMILGSSGASLATAIPLMTTVTATVKNEV